MADSLDYSRVEIAEAAVFMNNSGSLDYLRIELCERHKIF